MSKPLGLASLLLVSSALVAPSIAFAQVATPADTAAPPTVEGSTPPEGDTAPESETPTQEEEVDISIPGGDEIVVTGRRSANIVEVAPQVVSVLSSADIARTGEGDIAGALGRVTGLSVVGNGFVFVRGLGDRYSLALLNGSPLSSPEPLKRVVPLDLFPTSIIASSLVQKSYSVNFPGEFGGGVINLTTKAIPAESFLTVGGSAGGDSESTNNLGYTYFGSSIDYTGFTNANRNIAPALASYFASGDRLSEGKTNTQAIVGQLFNARNSVIQRNANLPGNAGGAITGGASTDIGDVRVGVIGTLGYNSKWRTRDTIQQTASTADLGQKELDFRRVITDNRVVVNGLLGFGAEFGDNKVRWTNLYIRDSLKQARLGEGTRQTGTPTATLIQQSTAWFERQLIDSHIVGEFKLADGVRLDVRGGYANAQREAPQEFDFEYFRSNIPGDPFRDVAINRLDNGQRGSANARFSDLNEDLWSASADLSYKVTPSLTASIGYAFSDTQRRTEVREFLITAPNTLPNGVALLRPDLLLAPKIVDAFGITIIDANEGNPVFDAQLRNHAAYVQIQAEIADGISLNAGVRYETAKQTVDAVQVFKNPVASLATTNLDRNYWLPAATLTLDVADKMQVRFNASKTIARPQFRELIFQNYFDPDNNRLFRGNPLLVDSQLYNAEARYEWYFARDQRFSIAGFFKRIDNPIETFASFSDNTVLSSFANAPKANLYGAEVELQKYFSTSSFSDADFWQSRRIVLIANYTFTKSNLKVGETDTTAVFAQASTKATDFFRDGVALTGQSDHLVNLQIGLEDEDSTSQQTILFTYASDRVTNRGASLQPDIIERPGIRLDFVARQGVDLFGLDSEIKLEARNLTLTKYQEFQTNGTNTIFYNRYRVGASIEVGLQLNF